MKIKNKTNRPSIIQALVLYCFVACIFAGCGSSTSPAPKLSRYLTGKVATTEGLDICYLAYVENLADSSAVIIAIWPSNTTSPTLVNDREGWSIKTESSITKIQKNMLAIIDFDKSNSNLILKHIEYESYVTDSMIIEDVIEDAWNNRDNSAQ